MTYKIKSLIYFTCFLVACLLYYGIEQQDDFTNKLDSETFVEAEFDDVDEILEEPEDDFGSDRQ